MEVRGEQWSPEWMVYGEMDVTRDNLQLYPVYSSIMRLYTSETDRNIRNGMLNGGVNQLINMIF